MLVTNSNKNKYFIALLKWKNPQSCAVFKSFNFDQAEFLFLIEGNL